MHIYTVHEPAAGGVKLGDSRGVIFIREGFCWMALFAPLFWMLYHRMWIEALAYTGLSILIGALAQAEGGQQLISGLMGLAFSLIVAYEAFELRRRHLRRKGFRHVASIAAKNLDLAEMRYFTGRSGVTAIPAPGEGAAASGLAPNLSVSSRRPLAGRESGWGFMTGDGPR